MRQISHKEVESHLEDELDWPMYYAAGEGVDAEDFVPAYYRVEGPNGPVSYMNPNSGPHPTTMYDFAMEAKSEHFRWCEKSETPWADADNGKASGNNVKSDTDKE